MKQTDIKLLMRKKDELLAKRQGILDKAVEEERGYTDEEREEVQKLQGQVADFDEQIKEAQEIERQRAGIPAGQGNIADLLRGQSGDPAPTECRFKNLGHFVRDIWQARRGNMSELLRNYAEGMETSLRAMNISDGTSLGFMIPDTFEAGTLQLVGAGGWIRQRARVIPAGEYPDARFRKRVLKQGAGGVYNGILVNYIGEGVAPTDESKLEYFLFTLDPSDKKIGLFYITSEETLQNPTAVTADMEQSLRGSVAELEDDLFINGDGVGKPKGILNSDGIRLINRNTSSDFKFADVLQMSKFMYPRAVNRNWELSLDLYDKVGGMTDGASRYIMIAGDATKGIPDLLHGRPIHWSEVLPAIGNRGDAMLVDWSFYFIKDGSGPFFATDPYTRFLEGEIRVKMTIKMDGDTWVKEPLKLKNGMEVSPFVILEV
jgi:HK97 family phage major capsid protein